MQKLPQSRSRGLTTISSRRDDRVVRIRLSSDGVSVAGGLELARVRLPRPPRVSVPVLFVVVRDSMAPLKPLIWIKEIRSQPV